MAMSFSIRYGVRRFISAAGVHGTRITTSSSSSSSSSGQGQAQGCSLAGLWVAQTESPQQLEGLKGFNIEKKIETDAREERLFKEIKQRFLRFKKNKFLKEAEHYQALAKLQSPKFLVIACADSRVCPSNVLGFQPGEAFMIRNVANLVPSNKFGTSETGAALEFAVKFLEIENILVIGHSCCAGIENLMSMKNVDSRSYIDKWVINGKSAKLRTEAVAAKLNFQEQCKHCEKESINESLRNLITYPWIENRVEKGILSLYGGYYDFVNCTFERWSLDLGGSEMDRVNGGVGLSTKDRVVWR